MHSRHLRFPEKNRDGIESKSRARIRAIKIPWDLLCTIGPGLFSDILERAE
jgi:hypothetical protein